MLTPGLEEQPAAMKPNEAIAVQQNINKHLEVHSWSVPDFDKEVAKPLKDAQDKAAIGKADAEETAREQEATRQQTAAAEAARTQSVVVAAPVQSTASGNCTAWLQQAGVTDIVDAMALINRESGCNPTAINPKSGACNVAQELPCGKSGCAFGDGACSVTWMNSYVLARYGSWANALGHSNSIGWY